ncbi:glycosyltransferase [Acinetobacter radioresistens]|uniref:glycosyltransferase n=1 Tax=Acinetobacter radioresistens TaxID=40216 RepID=UPI0032140837
MSKIEYPLVSVVVACYNHEKFVQDCIDSILRQTYQNIELIIIDDGSTDNSVKKIKEMVEQCKQRFTRFEFRYRPNKGLTATLNEALEWCKGEYYSPFASDDIMLPEKIKIQVNYLEKERDICAVFGNVNYIDEENREKINHPIKAQEYVFDKIFLNECTFYAPTQMLRLNIVKELGGYNSNILVEDWYMWLKIAKKGKIFCLSQKLALYRIHSTNSTKNTKFIYENNLKTLAFYKNHNLYKKSYAKIRWSYITWTGQENKVKALKLLYLYIKEYPLAIFSRHFLVFCKYFFVKIKDWY